MFLIILAHNLLWWEFHRVIYRLHMRNIFFIVLTHNNRIEGIQVQPFVAKIDGHTILS